MKICEGSFITRPAISLIGTTNKLFTIHRLGQGRLLRNKKANLKQGGETIMKISKHSKELIVLTSCIGFIILIGNICGLSEEFLEKIVLGFLGFEIIANLDISIERQGKRKWAFKLKFFTKTN